MVHTTSRPDGTLTRIDPIYYLVDASTAGFNGFHESSVWLSLLVAALVAVTTFGGGGRSRGARLAPQAVGRRSGVAPQASPLASNEFQLDEQRAQGASRFFAYAEVGPVAALLRSTKPAWRSTFSWWLTVGWLSTCLRTFSSVAAPR